MRWLGPDALAIVRPKGLTIGFLLLRYSVVCTVKVLLFALTPFFNLNLYVLEENSWIS